MKRFYAPLMTLCLVATLTVPTWAQLSTETPTSQESASNAEVADKLADQVQGIGDTLNDSEAAQAAAAGILQPIYEAADYLAFPTFYWIAFALMTAGVISFAFQLVFAKFFLLFKAHLNIKEILSDCLGLVISCLGLILTTQAATQNSTFPESPLAVLSATALGGLMGLVFYWWGQKQEFAAAKRPVEKTE